MTANTRAARQQIALLIRYYVDEKERPDAAYRLFEDLARARRQIDSDPSSGFMHPRPYPSLATMGFRWVNVRAYWVSWAIVEGRPVVTNVFHVSADIEGRATPDMDGIEDW